MANTLARAPLWLLLGLCLAVAAPAAAAEADRIEHLNKKAMEDYDALEFDSARRTLVDCVARLRAAGLDETPLAAKTYTHLGIVYIAGFHDRGRGQQQFERALRIDPTLRLDPALATPELQEVWDAAIAALPRKKRERAQEAQRAEAPAPAEPAPAPRPAPAEPRADALQHTPLDEVAAGHSANIYAHPTVSIARAVLFYRPQGQEQYEQAPMGRSRKQPGEIVGQVPAGATRGRSFQYYIEAYDGGGAVIARLGSPESPFIVLVSGGKAPPRESEDSESPIAAVKQTERPREPWHEHVYFGVDLGSGGAIIAPGATTEVAWYYDRAAQVYKPAVASSGGFIWSGLGIRAEAGGYLWKGMSLGVSARFEPYLNHNADSSATQPLCTRSDGTMVPCYATTSKGEFGFIGLAKLRYQFLRRTIFRPYVHFDIGGGIWRGGLNIDGSKPMSGGMVDNASPLQPTDICSATYNGKTGSARDPEGCASVGQVPGYNLQSPKPAAPNLNRVCPMNGPCVDAVLLGYAMVGGGAGFYLGGQHAGLSVDVNLLLAFGGAQFGALLDVYAGPQFIF